MVVQKFNTRKMNMLVTFLGILLVWSTLVLSEIQLSLPRYVRVNSYFKVVCSITTEEFQTHGGKKLELSFYKNNSNIPLSSSQPSAGEANVTLIHEVASAQREDGGWYACRLKNRSVYIPNANDVVYIGEPPQAPSISCVMKMENTCICCLDRSFKEIKTLEPLSTGRLEIKNANNQFETCLNASSSERLSSERCCSRNGHSVSQEDIEARVRVANDFGFNESHFRASRRAIAKPDPPLVDRIPEQRSLNLTCRDTLYDGRPPSAKEHFCYFSCEDGGLDQSPQYNGTWIIRNVTWPPGVIKVINNLVPNQWIRCALQLHYHYENVTYGLLSEESIVVERTLEDIPAAPPSFLPAFYRGEGNTVTLFFETVPLSQRNGFITQYKFECINKNETLLSGYLPASNSSWGMFQCPEVCESFTLLACTKVDCSSTARSVKSSHPEDTAQFHLVERPDFTERFAVVVHEANNSCQPLSLLVFPKKSSGNVKLIPRQSCSNAWIVNLSMSIMDFHLALFNPSSSSSVIMQSVQTTKTCRFQEIGVAPKFIPEFHWNSISVKVDVKNLTCFSQKLLITEIEMLVQDINNFTNVSRAVINMDQIHGPSEVVLSIPVSDWTDEYRVQIGVHWWTMNDGTQSAVRWYSFQDTTGWSPKMIGICAVGVIAILVLLAVLMKVLMFVNTFCRIVSAYKRTPSNVKGNSASETALLPGSNVSISHTVHQNDAARVELGLHAPQGEGSVSPGSSSGMSIDADYPTVNPPSQPYSSSGYTPSGYDTRPELGYKTRPEATSSSYGPRGVVGV